MTCPGYGGENRPGARYCDGCGARLDARLGAEIADPLGAYR